MAGVRLTRTLGPSAPATPASEASPELVTLGPEAEQDRQSQRGEDERGHPGSVGRWGDGGQCGGQRGGQGRCPSRRPPSHTDRGSGTCECLGDAPVRKEVEVMGTGAPCLLRRRHGPPRALRFRHGWGGKPRPPCLVQFSEPADSTGTLRTTPPPAHSQALAHPEGPAVLAGGAGGQLAGPGPSPLLPESPELPDDVAWPPTPFPYSHLASPPPPAPQLVCWLPGAPRGPHSRLWPAVSSRPGSRPAPCARTHTLEHMQMQVFTHMHSQASIHMRTWEHTHAHSYLPSGSRWAWPVGKPAGRGGRGGRRALGCLSVPQPFLPGSCAGL